MLKLLSKSTISILSILSLLSLSSIHSMSYFQNLFLSEANQENNIPKYHHRLKKTIKYRKHATLKEILEKKQANPNTPILKRGSLSQVKKYPLETAINKINIPALFLLIDNGAIPTYGLITETAIKEESLEAISLFLANYTYKPKELEKTVVNAEKTSPLNTTPKRNYILSILWDTLKNKKLKKANLELPPKIYERKNKYHTQISNDNIKIFLRINQKICHPMAALSKKQIEQELSEIKSEIFRTHYNGSYLAHRIAEVLPELIGSKKIMESIDPNTLDEWNRTPAHIIATKIIQSNVYDPEKLEVPLTLLLQEETNPCLKTLKHQKICNHSLWTMAIDGFLLCNKPKLFTLLLEHARLKEIDPQTGETALHQILDCTLKYPKAISLLKKLLKKIRKAGVISLINQGDLTGFTPLHKAILFLHPEIISLLLRYKANPNQKNKFGQTPIDILESLYRNNKIMPSKYQKIKNLFPQKD